MPKRCAGSDWRNRSFGVKPSGGMLRGAAQPWFHVRQWPWCTAGRCSKRCQWYRLAAEQDDHEAVRGYRLAAEQGHAEAQLNLGFMYANGGAGVCRWTSPKRSAGTG